jgi:hypothetical protein
MSARVVKKQNSNSLLTTYVTSWRNIKTIKALILSLQNLIFMNETLVFKFAYKC